MFDDKIYQQRTAAQPSCLSERTMRRGSMLVKLCCVILLIIQKDTESTQVIGGSRTVVQGEDVDLSCRLIETTDELEQITWQKSTVEEKQNHNFLLIYPNGVTKFIALNGLSGRVQFIGNPSENLGSIRITAVRLLDEGTFTCIFSVFPSGAHTTEIPLTVLVPPIVSVTVDVPTVIGENEVVLATCVAACAKPQAEVTWKTGAFGSLLRTVTNSTQHANGTTTVLSHLLGVPTRAANQQQVQCVVNQSALATERSYNYTIDIHYPPQTVNITLSEASKATVFLCVADGNPQPNYTWSRVVQPWPGSSVRAEGDILHLLSLSSELNGLYVCEASNPYGRATGSLYVHTSSGIQPWPITSSRHHHRLRKMNLGRLGSNTKPGRWNKYHDKSLDRLRVDARRISDMHWVWEDFQNKKILQQSNEQRPYAVFTVTLETLAQHLLHHSFTQCWPSF